MEPGRTYFYEFYDIEKMDETKTACEYEYYRLQHSTTASRVGTTQRPTLVNTRSKTTTSRL